MQHDLDYATYLGEDGLKDVQALEQELGATLLAYATPPVPAALSEAQLAKIKALEEKHCVRLVAYRGH